MTTVDKDGDAEALVTPPAAEAVTPVLAMDVDVIE